ncbi:uncharacterized protein BO80DRAFT_428578 [Aspergillus ibericus CBS 121593]|uniref:Uncharacterized protein n=1 Tax=Aspergillus ibericus CBS 121593 TaxID=1448316 RepID=A0A395GNW3_9EURO|nr:hypothetical protein BO80DRAFT_428578 [Aspergillus ibericus CBS 121593]RAK97064.1 hypothetical protein BO80DRAFT_428578 [Aspergillus ibericus CBS 121593]
MNCYQLQLGSVPGSEERLSEVKQLEVHELLDPNFYKQPGAHVILMPPTQEDPDYYTADLRRKLTQRFRLPGFFFDHMGWDSNGFFGSVGISSSSSAGRSDRDFGGCGTFSRFLSKKVDDRNASPESSEYIWHYMGFSTLWLKHMEGQQKSEAECDMPLPSGETHIMLCFDLDKHMSSKLVRLLRDTDLLESQNEPFFLLKVALETVVAQFEEDLGSFRRPIRKIEKERYSSFKDNHAYSRADIDDTKLEQLSERYATLHEVSRHVIHISETLNAAVTNAAAILQDHKLWRRSLEASSAYPNNTARTLGLYSNLLSNLKLRADAFVSRMENEIKCASNLLGVFNNNISLQTLNTTRDELRVLQYQLFNARG